MGGDSQSHHHASFQRRFIIALGIALLLMLLIAIPLFANADLRLDLAHRYGLAPDRQVEEIAESEDGLALIVAPSETDRLAGGTEFQYHALYLAHTGETGTTLDDLNEDREIEIPQTDLDFIAASRDANYLLFRDDDAGSTLLNVETGETEDLPENTAEPEGIEGDWDRSIWSVNPGLCSGISPNQVYIACFKRPTFNEYLLGDWQLDVIRYGAFEERIEIYRGMGIPPIVGWSRDDQWVYFQNNENVWRAPVAPDDFEES